MLNFTCWHKLFLSSYIFLFFFIFLSFCSDPITATSGRIRADRISTEQIIRRYYSNGFLPDKKQRRNSRASINGMSDQKSSMWKEITATCTISRTTQAGQIFLLLRPPLHEADLRKKVVTMWKVGHLLRWQEKHWSEMRKMEASERYY